MVQLERADAAQDDDRAVGGGSRDSFRRGDRYTGDYSDAEDSVPGEERGQTSALFETQERVLHGQSVGVTLNI